jgi:hypothetical protein
MEFAQAAMEKVAVNRLGPGRMTRCKPGIGNGPTVRIRADTRRLITPPSACKKA